MLKRLTPVLLLMAILFAGCAPATSQQEPSLKIGSLPRIIDLPAYVAQQEGLFERQGVKVEIVPFRSTVEMNTALLAEQLDGIIQDVFEAVNMNKEQPTVKLVGRAIMPRMFQIIAAKDSGINSVSQLKGKQVAVATSTIIDYGLDRLLVANGLNSDDITRVNIPSMPLRLEALNQGQVPVAALSRPLSDMAVLGGGKIVVEDDKEPFAGPGLVFSLTALKNKSEAISRCVAAWQEAVEAINAEPAKYESLLAEIALAPASVSLEVPTFPLLALPSEAEVKSVVDWFIAKGLASKPLAYSDVVETKYLAK
ncbi:MAG: ABC transporter substrate-binding protein [Chloroflexota bacterium]